MHEYYEETNTKVTDTEKQYWLINFIFPRELVNWHLADMHSNMTE